MKSIDQDTGEIIFAGDNAEYWAAVINADVADGVRKFIDAGLHLIEAKEKLVHGEWGKLTGETAENGKGMLTFSASTAQRLMAIARDPRLSNPAHGQDLPSSWRTLYELTKLDDKQWNYGLDQGIIRPDMERKDIRKLLPVNLNNAEPIPLPPGKYSVLYADPPWRYEYAETDSRAIENQYPTMDLNGICAMPVEQLAAEDCVLFLWTTSPKLEESFQVIKAWGFEYRTCAVWVKDKIGMGYYFRQRHEMLLVAKRGNLPVPEPKDRFDSVIEAPRTQHSAKPDVVYDMIERMYPAAERCELFARGLRDGWASWGNQANG